jgi:hypothetical protein
MRLRTLSIPLVLALAAVLAMAAPASATTVDQKVSVLNSFTQANSTSASAWNAARQNQAAWASYTFDWSTDYCSDSPDQPLGFDFRMPCWRHDFGYRNYKDVGLFPANKDHVDSAFYFDLLAKCGTYSWIVRPVCDGLAWTYYTAVHLFGSVVIASSTLDHYAAMKAKAERSTE